MEKFKRILKKTFVLPPLPTILLAVLGYAFIIIVASFHINIPAVQYLAYISSAYALIITITGFHYFIEFVRSIKQNINNHPIIKKLLKTSLGSRYFNDIRFKTKISLYRGLFINLLYIAMKLFSGIYYHSAWFISLAGYYILLAVMRYVLLHRGKKKQNADRTIAEIRRYRACGILLLVMNQALAGIVIFMVHQNKGFEYSGLLIYGMAVYAFYSVITAVIDLIKFRKHYSPVLSAAKVINLVSAMVSILSLETAMLAQFGGDDEKFRAVMTGATGGGVCTVVIGMAIYMIVKSTKELKKFKLTKPKHN